MSLPLSSNKDHWLECYKLTWDNRVCDRHVRFREWIEKEFEPQLVKTLSAGLGATGKPLCVLGIGSAEGNHEMLQLKKLKTKFAKLSTTVIEPNKQMFLQYQETVRQKSSDFTGIEFEWHNQTFQDYVQLYGVRKKYHFISMVHSIYYVGDSDLEETIRELYDILAPGGVILMVVMTDHTGIGKVVHTFPNLATKEQKSASSDPSMTKSNRLINSTDVTSILDKYKIVYTQSEYRESWDITACFTGVDTTKGNLLLDIHTQTINFKASVSTTVYSQVMDFLKDHMSVRKSHQSDEELCYFDTVSDILLITK
ncbi:histamine N-methyltransferase-like [Amphiura filiformis]|uniref:histamine N-methyltransferase-like n=1 Tax=Amphiura filiformis TaxID=82378 RepID=UPI003B2126E8